MAIKYDGSHGTAVITRTRVGFVVGLGAVRTADRPVQTVCAPNGPFWHPLRYAESYQFRPAAGGRIYRPKASVWSRLAPWHHGRRLRWGVRPKNVTLTCCAPGGAGCSKRKRCEPSATLYSKWLYSREHDDGAWADYGVRTGRTSPSRESLYVAARSAHPGSTFWRGG